MQTIPLPLLSWHKRNVKKYNAEKSIYYPLWRGQSSSSAHTWLIPDFQQMHSQKLNLARPVNLLKRYHPLIFSRLIQYARMHTVSLSWQCIQNTHATFQQTFLFERRRCSLHSAPRWRKRNPTYEIWIESDVAQTVEAVKSEQSQLF